MRATCPGRDSVGTRVCDTPQVPRSSMTVLNLVRYTQIHIFIHVVYSTVLIIHENTASALCVGFPTWGTGPWMNCSGAGWRDCLLEVRRPRLTPVWRQGVSEEWPWESCHGLVVRWSRYQRWTGRRPRGRSSPPQRRWSSSFWVMRVHNALPLQNNKKIMIMKLWLLNNQKIKSLLHKPSQWSAILCCELLLEVSIYHTYIQKQMCYKFIKANITEYSGVKGVG